MKKVAPKSIDRNLKLNQITTLGISKQDYANNVKISSSTKNEVSKRKLEG